MENSKPGDGLESQSSVGTAEVVDASALTGAEAATPAPRKFKRKLTTFLAQEMLYEYAIETLDNERRIAVEDFVAGDRECQAILESIRGSLSFAEKLSGTQLKPGLLTHLSESENVISLSRRYSKWHTWPDSMRWSIVAVSISIVVAGAVAMVPWQKISQTAQHKGPESIEVAKIPTETTEQLKTIADNSELDATTDEGSGDEGDVADAGSGDTDEAGSADTAAVAASANQLSPAQIAKQAQDERKQAKADALARKAQEEAARKAEARERKLAARSGAGRNSADNSDFNSVGISSAPMSLSRKQMPLIAGLLDHLFVTPLGVLPQTAVAHTALVADTEDSTTESGVDQQSAAEESKTYVDGATDAGANPVVAPGNAPTAVADAGSAAKPAPDTGGGSINSSRHSGGDESDADSSGDTSVPSRAANAPLGGAAATGTTALTISQIPETAPKGGIKPKGFVYRAFMNLDDLDTLGPKITQLIQELGGVKAGEVELGWKKGNAVRYYHFSMPEDSQEKLLEQLQTYGPVRISKDPHPRVMPKGQVRFILWVESSKSAH